MNSPKQPDPPQGSRPDSPPISDRRRKLLRAAVASAPVIATLRSGAAMANVSAYQCLINDDARDDGLVQITESTTRQGGGWLQIQVPRRLYTGTYTCTIDDPGNPDLNDGQGCNTPAAPSTPQLVWDVLLYDGRFYEYKNEQYLDQMTEVSDPSTLSAESGTNWTLTWTHSDEAGDTPLDPVWAIAYYLRLDDYTDIVTGPDLLQRGATNWQALTGSCWTSLGGLSDT